MAFFGTFHVYLLRVNLSVAIVAMVDYEGLKVQDTGFSNVSDKPMVNVSFTVSTTTSPKGVQDSDEHVLQSCGNITSSTGKQDNTGKATRMGKPWEICNR